MNNSISILLAAGLLVASSVIIAAPLSPSNSDTFTLTDLGEDAQVDAEFGYAVSSAGNTLLIGAPRALVYEKKAGAVFQIGPARPVTAETVIKWHQGRKYSPEDDWKVFGGPEEGDRFGHTIVGHSSSQFFVGVPGEDLRHIKNAGMVNFIGYKGETYCKAVTGGSSKDKTPMDHFHQGNFNIKGKKEAYDRVGYALAIGDFNDDGGLDIAIGAPNEDVGNSDDAGGMNVLMGDVDKGLDYCAEGFTHFNNTAWSQSNLAGKKHADEHFGTALAAGDFNGDGVTDIAIGVPGDHYDAMTAKKSVAGGGAVNIIYGDAYETTVTNEGGPTLVGNELINQALDGISGGPEKGDGFGAALAVGDFDDDGVDDLVIGVPGEDIGDVKNAGMVHILYGSDGRFNHVASGGLVIGSLKGRKANKHASFHQKTKDIRGKVERGDLFGAALAAGDVNNDGVDDLIVGVPGEDVGNVVDAGAIQIIYGSKGSGLTAANNHLVDETLISGVGVARTGMRFGFSIATGDFNKDGKTDVAIGNGSNKSGGKWAVTPKIAGAVTVVYQ